MPSKQKILGSSLEQRVVRKAKEKGLDARVQPGSGVYRDLPSDCVVAQSLIECKVRSAEIDAKGHRTLRVDVGWLDGVQAHAKKHGFAHAALVVNAKGSQKPLALIDLDFFLDLLKLRKDEGELLDRYMRILFEEYRIPPEEIDDLVRLREMPVMPD